MHIHMYLHVGMYYRLHQKLVIHAVCLSLLRLLRVESVQLKVHDRARCSGLLLTAARDGTIRYWEPRR